MDVLSSITGTIKSEHGAGALYLVLFAFIIGDAAPTPADSAFFIYSRKLREQYFAHEITPQQYWDRLGLSYYLFSIIWWILIFGIIILVKGDAGTKFKVFIALLSGGILIAVIHGLITKDERAQAAQQELLIPKQ